MPAVQIDDPVTGLPIASFAGDLIAHTSTRSRAGRSDGLARWGEFRAWKVPGSPPTWVHGKYGMSLVYHRADTSCSRVDGSQRGVPANADLLPDDAVPCSYCRPAPLDVLDAEADAGHLVPVRFEFPDIVITSCDTADRLIRIAATKRKRDSQELSVMLGGPQRELVAQCMQDPDFRDQVRDRMPRSAVG